MAKPVLVKFVGDRTVLMDLVNQEVLQPTRTSQGLVCKLSDIQRLFDRMCELEMALNSIRKVANDVQVDE